MSVLHSRCTGLVPSCVTGVHYAFCRHWVVPLHNETLVGNNTIPISAQQAVLDTGSSVMTAPDIDSFAINSVSSAPVNQHAPAADVFLCTQAATPDAMC